MKLFWTGIAKVLFYVISGALLVYAASRSIDFITATLPPDQQIIGFLGLAATSGGMIAWLLLFLYAAEGMGQRITAGIMTVLDMIGEFGLFTMDTLYQAGESGMTVKLTSDEIRMVVLSLSALIAVNILATVIYHLLEPGNLKRMREASVRDQLEAKTLKEIETRGDTIAEKLAPQIAKQWADQFESRFSDMTSLGLGVKSEEAKNEKPKGKTPMPKAQPASHYEELATDEETEAAELQPVPLWQPMINLGNGNGNGKHPNGKK